MPILGALKSLFELCSVAQACIGEFGSPDSSRAANGSRFAVRLEGMTSAIGCTEFSVGTHCGKRCAARNPTIVRKEITKAKTTYCYSLCRLKQSVENGGKVRCRERLGALVKYYERESAKKSTRQRAMGSQSAYIKDAGNLPWQKTSRD